MTDLGDAPVRFFLEHQREIAEWAQLAKEAQKATAAELQRVGRDLLIHERVASGEILVGDQVIGEAMTGPVLYRASWMANPVAPDVGVALGWDGPVDPACVWPNTSRPYTGVLTSHFTPTGKQIEEVLRRHPDTDYGGGSGSPRPRVRAGTYWVVYRPVESPPDWWKDRNAWRAEWVERLIDDWDRWSPIIDRAADAEQWPLGQDRPS